MTQGDVDRSRVPAQALAPNDPVRLEARQALAGLGDAFPLKE